MGDDTVSALVEYWREIAEINGLDPSRLRPVADLTVMALREKFSDEEILGFFEAVAGEAEGEA